MIIAVAGVLISAYWVLYAVRGLFWRDSVPEAAYGMMLGVIFGAILFRAARACALVDGSHLKIVNTFRTSRIEASEIHEFRLGPRQSTIFYGAAAVEMRNGDELIIFGIQSYNPLLRGEDDGARKLVQQLNDWLLETRTDASSTPATA